MCEVRAAGAGGVCVCVCVCVSGMSVRAHGAANELRAWQITPRRPADVLAALQETSGLPMIHISRHDNALRQPPDWSLVYRWRWLAMSVEPSSTTLIAQSLLCIFIDQS